MKLKRGASELDVFLVQLIFNSSSPIREREEAGEIFPDGLGGIMSANKAVNSPIILDEGRV